MIKALETGHQTRRNVLARAIGAGAINQAVKAIAFARGILARSYNVELGCRIFFVNLPIPPRGHAGNSDNGREETTAVMFQLFDIARLRI